MNVDELHTCILHGLERVSVAIRNTLQRRKNGVLWRTMEWQRSKRLIARVLSDCICKYTSCHVYFLDIHGGEPSTGLGDKDIDLVLECPTEINIERIETIAETLVLNILKTILGDNPYRILGVPNIVELHLSNEYLFKKYLKAGPPYAFRIC